MLVLNNFVNDARIHKEALTLASAGYNVSVIALWQPGLAMVEHQSGYIVIRLQLRSRSWQNRLISPLIKYLEYTWKVWRLAAHEPSQIYHANDANTLPAAWLAAKRNHAKLIYDAHEFESGRNFSSSKVAGIYRKLWALPEKIFIHQADAIITVSQSIAVELARIYDVKTPTVILNCPEKMSLSSSNRLQGELNIDINQKILIYQGRITAGRGIEAFICATQLLENVVAVILGDGPLLHAFRQRSESGEWKRVHFLGQVSMDDLPAYTTSADIGIVLTQDICLNHHFSLPNKLFEYLYAGLPVIGSKIPEVERIINTYQVGELVDPESPSSIIAGIQSILADPARYEQMKANALKVSEKYNWQNESKKLLKIYEILSS
jgi:glycosyltransferase involved in cell wall biosynthesis